MNIHKFNAKPKPIPPKTIQWRLLREVKYPASAARGKISGSKSKSDDLGNF